VSKRALSQIAGRVRAGVFSDLQRHIDEAMVARAGDLVPLHIGDTCAPPPIAEEGVLRSSEVATYGATAGLGALREALAARLQERGFGPPTIDAASEVCLGVGATHALACAARVILDPGDEVIMASPYWPLAHGIVSSTGATMVEVPLSSVLYADPSRDAGDILRAVIGPKTRALYFITPNNPDGKVFSRRDLESIARVVEEFDLWVIADEVYAEYTYGAEHLSFARLPGMAERTISAYSFSKSHALAGARVGAIVGPPEVILAAKRLSTHSVFNVPVPMQRVALEALASGNRWVDQARADYRAARDAAASALAGARATFSLAEGGVYLFLDFSELLAGRPLSLLLERAVANGVLLAPGAAFGADFENSARLCYTCVPRPRLLEGITRLRTAMDEIAGG
jgi:aspartate/methionine/tyrosine aminotransferase